MAELVLALLVVPVRVRALAQVPGWGGLSVRASLARVVGYRVQMVRSR